MAKSDITIKLERSIWSATHKQGVFGCFEVTIGWFGDERVDYMTYDTKGNWRCYEIKATKKDFYSTSKKTFVGHFNYYVMTPELYEQVVHDIPKHIGVYVWGRCWRKAKRQELKVDEQVLKNSMIRSLCREFEKQYRSGNPTTVERLERRIRQLERELDDYRDKYRRLLNIGYKKYGPRWYIDEEEAT